MHILGPAPKTAESETLAICVLTSLPGDPEAHSSLRNIVLHHSLGTTLTGKELSRCFQNPVKSTDLFSLFASLTGLWRTLKQRSPAFLAPGTGFVEHSFSMDREGEAGVVLVVM